MKSLYIAAIRVPAAELVGTCSDYQILYCAREARVLSNIYLTSDGGYAMTIRPTMSLEDLAESELVKISDWMSRSKNVK
jgi:hypothetical protein